MSREISSSRLLQAAGASSYHHDSDNINGGDQGGGSSTQQAISDISSSRSQRSLSLGCIDHEFQKPLLLLDDADVNSDKATADHIIVDNTNKSNNFLCHRSINHGDIRFRADSLINFKNSSAESDSFMNGKGSLLSFDQNHQIRINRHKEDDDDDSFIWKDDDDNVMTCYVDNNSRQVIPASDPEGSSSSRILDQINNYNYQPGSISCGWLYSDSTVISADRVQGTGLPERTLSKRPYMGDQSTQPSKKQCTTIAKSSSSKPNKPASSKDPQSMAAKNRRERISERLKILQELVPNGPKVDLVTMLDKAISYVKFLQLQVKVLATDEFWPAQGGKAPDIAQVKEAIDAILASQRERSSSSK